MAAGSPVPAGLEPPVPGEPPKPTAHERTLMRRRLRALRRSREALLLDADGADVEQLDAEARALAEALDQLKTLDQLIASGIVKRCSSCGELTAPREGDCSACGQGRADRGPRTADRGRRPRSSSSAHPGCRPRPAARGSAAD